LSNQYVQSCLCRLDLKKQCLFLLFFFSALFSVASSANSSLLNAQEQLWIERYGSVSLAGETDWVPFDFVDENGRFQGIAWDYLQLIGEKTGLTFDVQTGTWTENLAKIQTQKVDLLPAINHTDEREKTILFTSAYYNTLNYFFIHEAKKEGAPVDMAGLRVAIPKGFATADYVRTYFPQIEIITVDSIEAAIDSVLSGDADLLYDAYVVLQYWLEQDGISAITPFISARANSHDELYFGVRHDLPILQSILNKGLAAISVEEHNAIIRRWLLKPLTNSLSLTKQEKQWLAENPTITFTGDPNWLPYEAFDAHGNYVGVVAEYLALIEAKLNINIEYLQTESWAESVDLVKQGKVNVLSETTDSTLGKNLIFTEPYLSSPIVIVMNDEAIYVDDLGHIADKKIAMIHQYGYVETIKKAYPKIDFVEVYSIQEGLTAVSTGKVDALVATLAQTSYHLSELGINNVHIVGQTPFKTELAFGIADDKPILASLFNRAIQSISPAEKQQILNRWGRFDLKPQYDIALIIKITIVALIIVMTLVFWNRKLAAEVALRKQAEDQMKMVIDRIPLQVIISNHLGEVLVINPKVLEDFSVSVDQAKEFKVTDVYAKQSDRISLLQELAANGEVTQKMVDFRRLDGEIRTMMISVMPITYQNEQALLSIAVDMTERVQLENDLVAAKVKAELANQTKSTFLANMSHEIRTPMNAIIGFSEILQEKISDKKLKAYAATIQSASNDLLNLINGILDLSKVEAGKMELHYSPSDLRDLFYDLKKTYQLSVKEKGLTFELDIDELLPSALLVDAHRLRQVLTNLVANAIKFTDQGGVQVGLELFFHETDPNIVDLRISVKDTGIGINLEEIETIFEDFGQVEGQDVAKFGGTGLGLSISYKLVQLMGGSMFVGSEQGVGTTFTIYLRDVEIAPLAYVEVTQDTDEEIIFDKATILVVDDIDTNRTLVKESFSSSRIHVDMVENGQEAIDYVQHKQPDLVLMDLRMPVMSGEEAAEWLKKNGFKMPIIALTASVMREDLTRLRGELFDDFLRKPFKKKELTNKLAKFLPYKTKQRDSETDELQLSEHELARLPELLDKLSSLMPLWESVKNSNNISEIKAFSAQLRVISDSFFVRPLDVYCEELTHHIDTFDISGINASLEKLEALFNDFKSSSNTQ
jgi:two-component system sensor histidine kinase EvgS